MMRNSSPWRRRPRGRFVLTYLEGVPTPTTLINRIAGADLSSSSWTDFLSTAPRYINAQQEQRLSTLFFHHVLYPAGGARRPYQPIVVRAGRLVIPSPLVVCQPIEDASTPASSSSSSRVRVAKEKTVVPKNPLAVPDAWQHLDHDLNPDAPGTRPFSSSTAVTSQEVVMPTSQQWARADPARQAYFYSSASPSVKASVSNGEGGGGRFDFEMGRPRFSIWHAPASSATRPSTLGSSLESSASSRAESTKPSQGSPRRPAAPLIEPHRRSPHEGGDVAERGLTDEAFRGLRGVVESYWKAFLPRHADQDERVSHDGNDVGSCDRLSTAALTDALTRLQVNPSAGWLLFGATVPRDTEPMKRAPTSSGTQRVETVPDELSADVLLKSATHKGSGSSPPGVLAAVLNAALAAPTSHHGGVRGRQRRHLYVQTQLPDAAFAHVWTTTATEGQKSEGRGGNAMVRVSRLAGGVMPHVSFAVGQPFAGTTSPPAESNSRREAHGPRSGLTAEKAPNGFAHLTAVLRLDLQPALREIEAQTHDPSTNTSQSGSPHGTLTAPTSTTATRDVVSSHTSSALAPTTNAASTVTEPWRLGHALDPTVPYIARTVSDLTDPVFVQVQPTTSACDHRRGHVDAIKNRCDDRQRRASEACKPEVNTPVTTIYVGRESLVAAPRQRVEACYECVLGRHDAETYFLPQRELVLELIVPEETRTMCVQQNQDRVSRQASLGHARGKQPSHTAADGIAWPMEQRRTAERSARGRFVNMMEADAPPAAPSSPVAHATPPRAGDRFIPPHVVYEVRALPGDVVYIPRRWGYRVKRIAGTSIQSTAATATAGGGSDVCTITPASAAATHTRPTSSLSNASPVAAAAVQKQVRETNVEAEWQGDEGTHGRVTAVEVDAWCLVYRPYPDLTAEQAKVYVPANYVHRGVEEFYSQGGNRIHHNYE